jgi:hypothetical protein
MATIDRGTQQISFRWKHPAKAQDFNHLLNGAIKPGLCNTLTLTNVGNIVTFPTFNIFIEPTDDDTSLLHVETQGQFALEMTPISDEDYIYCTFTQAEQIDNYLDFNVVSVAASSGIIPDNTKIILGTATSISGVIQSVSTTGQTKSLWDENWNARFENDVTMEGTTTFSGIAHVINTIDSSSKDTGSIITEGGIGVEKNIYVGEDIHSIGKIYAEDTTDSTTKDTGSLITEGGIGVEKTLVTGGKVLVKDTTDSTTKDTGSIITEGGIGVEKTLVTGGKVLVKDTTASSSKDTGCAIFEGGIGVEEDIYAGADIRAGDDIVATDNITAGGNITNNGYLESGLGRRVSGSLITTGILSQIYTALSSVIPNTNDEIVINGVLNFNDSYMNILTKAERTDASTLKIYYFRWTPGGSCYNGSINVTSGSSSSYNDIQIIW